MANDTNPPSNRTDRRGSRWAPVLMILAYMAFWQVAPRVRDERFLTVIASTIVSLVLVVYVSASAARSLRRVTAMAAVGLASASVIVPLRVMLASGRLPAPWHWVVAVPGLAELTFILFGVSVGAALSLILRSANMIPPVAGVLALVDIWTVLLGGPVQRAMESAAPSAQRLTEAMTVRLPAPTSGAAPMAVVGFADFVFIAFFVAAMCRFEGDAVGYGGTVRPLAVVLAAYMVVVLLTGWPLPALVPMAAVVLTVHWRRFRYSRSEALALVYAGALVVLLLGGVIWLARR